MYKVKEITDETELWRDGQLKWEPLKNLHSINGIVHGMPNVVSNDKREIDESGVINDDMTTNDATKIVKLSIYRTELWCGVCRGNLATGHIPGAAEQKPDIEILRKPVGSTEALHEIMPGFMFVGDKDTAKLNIIVPHEITLVVGTADKFKNPAPRPPYFRCQMAKFGDRVKFVSMPAGFPNSIRFLEEGIKLDKTKIDHDQDEGIDNEDELENMNEENNDDDEEKAEEQDIYDPLDATVTNTDTTHSSADPIYDHELQKTLKLFERTSDWIEVERVNPEIVAQGDAPEPEYRGEVDRYGRPKKDSENSIKVKSASQRKKEGLEKKNPSRVLIWSKRGDNRSCAVAAAYFIKRFGVSVRYALELIKPSVPKMKITSGYMWALYQFSLKHTLGLLVCDDCTLNAVDDIHEERLLQAEVERERQMKKLSKMKPNGHANDGIDNSMLRRIPDVRYIEGSSVVDAGDNKMSEQVGLQSSTALDSIVEDGGIENDNKEGDFLEQDSNTLSHSCNESSGVSPQTHETPNQNQSSSMSSSMTPIRFGVSGLPYIESKKVRDKQEAEAEMIRVNAERKRAEKLGHQMLESSDAASRMRRRRRRSRYPNDYYDSVEAKAAASPILTRLCFQGIHEILPLCQVPPSIWKHDSYYMLCDVELSGRQLDDTAMMAVFDAFQVIGVGKNLRRINVSDNLMSGAGLESIFITIWPEFYSHHIHIPLIPYPSLQLAVLEIQNNKLDIVGAHHLARFLALTSCLMYLDMSCNPWTDEGMHQILHVMTKPGQEFEGDSDDDNNIEEQAKSKTPSAPQLDDNAGSNIHVDDNRSVHIDPEEDQESKSFVRNFNRSISSLIMRDVGMGNISGETLSNMISSASTITSLIIDANEEIPHREIKNILRAIKVQNKSLITVSSLICIYM
jgi:hypothetical protein